MKTLFACLLLILAAGCFDFDMTQYEPRPPEDVPEQTEEDAND